MNHNVVDIVYIKPISLTEVLAQRRRCLTWLYKANVNKHIDCIIGCVVVRVIQAVTLWIRELMS